MKNDRNLTSPNVYGDKVGVCDRPRVATYETLSTNV